MAAPEPEGAEDADELLVELLALQSRGDRDAVRLLLARAGERAHALRDALALTAELEDLGRLLGDEPGGLPDEIARLGRFEDLRPIADGGLARVYRARDPRLERDVALKVLHPDHAGADVARDWILAEGRALAGLQHDSVVRVFEVDEADGLAYVAMELVEGPTLHDVLRALRELDRADVEERHGPRTTEVARSLVRVGARLRLVRDLADALESCHLRGIVHRDVKPANVLIDPGGTPKLIDFGLAHRVEASTLGLTQQLVGTPGYLAPEQVENDSTGASPRSDQFSLGTVLYELLTLRHPFQAESRAATMHAVARAAPPPPRRVDAGITSDVERVCLHALERNPTDRYPSLAALREDLDALLEFRPISLSPDTIPRRASRWMKVHRRAVATLAVVALLLGALRLIEDSRARREVLAAVSGIAGRIGDVRRGDEAAPLYHHLNTLRERAEELDGSGLGRLIHGSTLPAVAETSATLARRCSELFEEDASSLRSSVLVEEQQGAQLQLFARWYEAITSERMLLGEDAPNAGLLRMGTARVPEDCTVWRLKDVDGIGIAGTRLGPRISKRALPVGTYRVTSLEGEELREVEFEVSAWSLATEYRPGAFRADAPRVTVDSPPRLSLGESYVFVQEPFELTVEPLRWRDVYASLAPRDLDGLVPGPHAPDDFVEGSWNLASELVRRMGARLPSALELHTARALGHVDLQDRVWTANRASGRESDDDRSFYDAGAAVSPLGDALPDLGPWVRSMNADGQLSGGSPRIHLARSVSHAPSRTVRR